MVVRRPGEHSGRKYEAHHFLPCEYCLGFILNESLWHHLKTCSAKPTTNPDTNYVRNARMLLAPFIGKPNAEKAKIDTLLSGMKETVANPGIRKICQNDRLIMEFTKSVLGRVGDENEQRLNDMDTTRTKVRTVGRLLKYLNRGETNPKPLTDYITGRSFNQVLNGVRGISKESDSPQLALNLGYYLKQIALLKISLGIQDGSPIDQEEGRNVQFLMAAHWNNSISCVAKRRQKLRTINKPVVFPITSDLVTIKDWLVKEINACIKNPQFNWTWEARLLLVRILLFNKRRVSEVRELKVTDFLQRQQDVDSEEILKSLDISERLLANRYIFA